MSHEVERVRTRAYFLWANRDGRSWKDPVSNWLEAEEDEASLSVLPGTQRWPYTVVDQNCLRDAEMLGSLANPLLLPDVAIAELFKGNSWEYVARRSLAVLSATPERVFLAPSLGELLRAERKTGELVGDLIDREVTVAFREFLRHFGKRPAEALADLRDKADQGRSQAAVQHFDWQENRTMVLSQVDSWSAELSPSEVRQLRREGVDGELFARILSDTSRIQRMASMLHHSLGYEKVRAMRLAMFPSVTGADIRAMSALGLLWLAEGGAEGASGGTLTNDVADLEYVVLSIFCHCFVSKEGRMRRLRSTLLNACESAWSSSREYMLKESKRDVV